jgi:hypothetical protein
VLTGAASLALALAIGWTPNHVAAQSTGTLVGTVTDTASTRGGPGLHSRYRYRCLNKCSRPFLTSKRTSRRVYAER